MHLAFAISDSNEQLSSTEDLFMLRAATAWPKELGMQGGERLCVHPQEPSLLQQIARSCSGPAAQP